MKLTRQAAREICVRQGHKERAQNIVDLLANRTRLSPREVNELVEEQINLFANSLVKCIENATKGASTVERLPKRSERGHALRRIREALENLRQCIGLNWELAKPFLEFETVRRLERLLTTEAAAELLPAKLRLESEYAIKANRSDKYEQQSIMRGYLLEAGSRPLTRLIKEAKIGVRRAEKKIRPGAPIKDPMSLALVLQLADHYEWQLGKKAAWSADGPFSRFCVEVFAAIGFATSDSWEHVLKTGLKYHRSSFISRRLHQRDEEPKIDDDGSRSRNSRKRKLKPFIRLKSKPKG